jgi:hypothetical protein
MDLHEKLSLSRVNWRRYFRRALLEILFWQVSALVWLTTLGAWRTWRRNSLALGYWSENSDLDITLYCPHDNSVPPSVLLLWRFFRRFGEWSAHTSSDRKWIDFANPLELKRDPKIIAAFNCTPRTASLDEAFVFWLRMSTSDHRIRSHSAQELRSREKKWNYHRTVLEQETGLRSSFPFPDFIDDVLVRLSPIPKETWQEREAYLRPHTWLTTAFSAGLEISEVLKTEDPQALELARAQVRWEFWGLLGQMRLRENYAEVHKHLEHLANMLPIQDPLREAQRDFKAYSERG